MAKKGYNKYLDLLNADLDVACKDLKIPSGQMSEILKECTEKLKSQYKIEEVQEVLAVPIDFQGDLTGTLKTQAIYELLGLPGSGKTYFAMAAAISWASENQVYYLDTEGSVSLKTLKSQCSNQATLKKILYSRVLTEGQLLKFLSKIEERISNSSLLIIDSINFLLKDLNISDISRPKFLARIGLNLQKAAQKKNLCIITTNNLTNLKQATLGESWGCVISKRFFFHQESGIFRISI